MWWSRTARSGIRPAAPGVGDQPVPERNILGDRAREFAGRLRQSALPIRLEPPRDLEPAPRRTASGAAALTPRHSSRRVHRSGFEEISSCVNLMTMRALQAPFIKFSVDGFRINLRLRFRCDAHAGNVGTQSPGWWQRLRLHRASGGLGSPWVLSGRETGNGVVGGGSRGQARRCVCRPCWSDTHNGFRLAACPLSGGLGNRVCDSCQ